MRVVVQRVSEAWVRVEGVEEGRIGRGLLVLMGCEVGDSEADAAWLARKVVGLRIFPDEAGLMNRSLSEVDGGILVVSQFTLLASIAKGMRPSFFAAAGPDEAVPLYGRFLALLETELGQTVARGVFGAAMEVGLVNDGPVTIPIDSRRRE